MLAVSIRVVNEPTSSGQNPAQTQKPISSPNHAQKKPKFKSGLKNLAVLANYFDYIFGHLRQKARLRPKKNQQFCQV